MVTTAEPVDVYSYVRFSTGRQMAGSGKRRQDDIADAWAKKHGHTLKKNYADLGVSAFKGKNATEGALSKFLDLVKDGKIRVGSILLVESLDRLSRDKIHAAIGLLLQVINAGIVVVTLTDGQTYSADKLDFAQLVLSMAIFMRANDESAMKSSRKAASWKYKREAAIKDGKPLGGNTPKWIRATKDGYVFNEPEAKKIRAIFHDYVNNGMGIYLLAKKYDVPKGTISFWLSSEIVIGTLVVNEGDQQIELPNHYPAVIDRATWKAVQSKKADRYIHRRTGGKVGTVNLFASLLVDAKGERMDVQRFYGFGSYTSSGCGYVIQQTPLEHFVCRDMIYDRLTTVEHVDDGKPHPQLLEVDAMIKKVQHEMTTDSDMLADLLPVLKKLKKQRNELEGAPRTVRHRVERSVADELSRDGASQEERLRLREMIRDSVKQIVLKNVQASNWYTLVDVRVDMIDGTNVTGRYAYCSRRVGYVITDGWRQADIAGVTLNRITADTLTPELIDELKKLPKRVISDAVKLKQKRRYEVDKKTAAASTKPRKAKVA